MKLFTQYQALYDQGVAVGSADIAKDTVMFRFKDEIFEFPTRAIYHLRFMNHGFNGYFYTAPVDELRKLEREEAQRA